MLADGSGQAQELCQVFSIKVDDIELRSSCTARQQQNTTGPPSETNLEMDTKAGLGIDPLTGLGTDPGTSPRIDFEAGSNLLEDGATTGLVDVEVRVRKVLLQWDCSELMVLFRKIRTAVLLV